MMQSVHQPILVQPIVEALIEPLTRLPADSASQWIVDCTLGGGGHTAALLQALASRPELKKHRVLSLDQDVQSVERGRERFQKEILAGSLEILHCRFGESAEHLRSRPVLGLMADLGFSSDQLEDASRGLSFQAKGPLDMRLDPTRGESCKELLQRISEQELEEILREYGEERFAKRIASTIISRRKNGRLPSTTEELVDAVVHGTPSFARHGRIHVATRTFQALRIAVNQELEELDQLLNHVIMEVRPGGRIAILSFHSLEDRRVKVKFKKREIFTNLTKKPIQADEKEMKENPRSRSAKLRIAEKI